VPSSASPARRSSASPGARRRPRTAPSRRRRYNLKEVPEKLALLSRNGILRAENGQDLPVFKGKMSLFLKNLGEGHARISCGWKKLLRGHR
jgi:hypothetical protein